MYRRGNSKPPRNTFYRQRSDDSVRASFLPQYQPKPENQEALVTLHLGCCIEGYEDPTLDLIRYIRYEGD
jgi:hypothetical protein